MFYKLEDERQFGINANLERQKYKAAEEYLEANPQYATRLNALTERYAILPIEVLDPIAKNAEIPVDSPSLQELCDDYTKQWCAQAGEVWEASRQKHNTGKHIEDMTMNYSDILFGLGSLVTAPYNRLAEGGEEKVKVGKTQTSLWYVALHDAISEAYVKYNPFNVSSTIEQPYYNEETKEFITSEQYNNLNPAEKLLYAIPGAKYLLKDNYMIANSRIWAYAQQMNAMDRYLEAGYTREEAQKFIPIDLSATKVEGLGQKENWLNETLQWIKFAKEAKSLGGEAYLFEMLNQVNLGRPVNYNRDNVLTVESLLAENMPEYEDLINSGMTEDEAKKYIYARIGTPIVKPNEDGEINWTSIQNPNQIEAFAGRRFIYNPELADEYAKRNEMNINEKLGIKIPYSQGRYQASINYRVGSEAYNRVSGWIDGKARIIPELVSGGIVKGARQSKKLLKVVNKINDYEELYSPVKKRQIVSDWAIANNKNPVTGETVEDVLGTLDTIDIEKLNVNKFVPEVSDTLKLARKQTRKLKREYGLMGFTVKGVLAGTPTKLVTRLDESGVIDDLAKTSSILELENNSWTRNFPPEIKQLITKTDDKQELKNIFTYAYGDGYQLKGLDTPFFLQELPKGQSYILNEAIKKATGVNPGLPSLGSIAGRSVSKALEVTDKSFRGVYRGAASALRTTKPIVLDDTKVLNINDYNIWKNKGERLGRNLGFYSELTAGMSPYWRKKMSILPGSNIPYASKLEGYNNVVKQIMSTGLSSKVADNLLDEFIGMNYTINNVNKFARKLAEAQIDDVAVKSNPKRAEILQRHYNNIFDNEEQIQMYLVDPKGKMLTSPWTARMTNPDSGETTFIPTITKLSEAASQGAPLLNRRVVDRTLGKYFDEIPELELGTFMDGVKIYAKELKEQGIKNIKIPTPRIQNDVITMVLDTWMGRLFKPKTIVKPALTQRVLLEEQLYFAVHPNLKGALDSPLFYMQWLFSYGYLPKRSWVKKLMKNVMDSGQDVNEVTLGHLHLEAINANLNYNDFNVSKINKRNTIYQPVKPTNSRAVEARIFQFKKLYLDPISRKVASYDSFDDVVAWSTTNDAIKLRDRLIDATGSTFTIGQTNGADDIRIQENWIKYLKEREFEIRMNTGMALQEGVDYTYGADGIPNYDVTKGFTGSLELRKGIAHGVFKDVDGTEVKLLPKYENIYDKYTPKDNAKFIKAIKNYVEAVDEDGNLIFDFGYAILPKNPNLNIPGTGALEKYDLFLESIFDTLLASPLARLNRSPIFKQNRWLFLSGNFEKFSPALQAKFIDEAEKAKIPNYMIKKIKGIAALQSGTQDNYRAWSDLAGSYAVREMKSYLYDTKNRHRISDVTRNIFPFPEVFIEVGKRWGKAFVENPFMGKNINLANKGFQTLTGTDVYAGEGYFGIDPVSDQETFLYPWNETFNNLLYGDGTNFKMVAKGYLGGINMVSTQAFPSSQPMVQVAIDELMDATEVNQKFQDQFFGDFPPPKDLAEAIKGSPNPWYNKYRAGTKGSKLGIDLIRETFSDTYVDPDNNFINWDMNDMHMSMRAESTLNLFEAVKSSYDQQRLLETGQLDKYINDLMDNWDGKREVVGFDELLTYFQQTGKDAYPYKPGQLTPEILDKATLKWSALKAQQSLVFRSLAQFGFPTGFVLKSAIQDKSGKWWATAVLAEEYSKLVQKHYGNQKLAANEFYSFYGIDHAYLTTTTKDKTAGAKVYDRSVVQWKKKHEKEIQLLPNSYNLLNPSNPQAERTFDQMIYETTRNPLEWNYASNDTAAWFRKQRYAEQTKATFGDNAYSDYLIRAYTNALEEAYPGYNDAYGKRSTASPQDIFEEMETYWLTLDFPQNYESGKGFKLFYENYWNPMVEMSQEESGTGSTTWWRNSKDPVAFTMRKRVADGAYGIIEDYPEFLSVYQNVIIRLFAGDTEFMDYTSALEEKRRTIGNR